MQTLFSNYKKKYLIHSHSSSLSCINLVNSTLSFSWRNNLPLFFHLDTMTANNKQITIRTVIDTMRENTKELDFPDVLLISISVKSADLKSGTDVPDVFKSEIIGWIDELFLPVIRKQIYLLQKHKMKKLPKVSSSLSRSLVLGDFYKKNFYSKINFRNKRGENIKLHFWFWMKEIFFKLKY